MQGLTERVRAVKYCCKAVLGAALFPGVETPVAAELWPGVQPSLPPSIWHNLMQHNLVELQITVADPEHALRGLKSAMTCGERICGTLRCLQVDRPGSLHSLPMCAVTTFLAGLKLPCLVHLGFKTGVVQIFRSSCDWPEKESLPMLQSFGGTRKPAGIFGLGMSGIHTSLVGIDPAADMAAMADSALGPAIRELHIIVYNYIWQTWEGRQAAGVLASLSSLQRLSIKEWGNAQVHIEAEAINTLHGLQELALGDAVIHGDLTGPRLTQIVCLTPRTQLLTVLARPPPALTSILVPCMLYAEVPRAVLGIDVPRETEVVRASPAGPRWKVSHDTCALRDWHADVPVNVLVRAVRCREEEASYS